MKVWKLFNASLTVVCFAALLVGCASDASQAEDVTQNGAADKKVNGDNVEVESMAVDDPCMCFDEGLSRGQLRFCRESKREVAFLEALRKCGSTEVEGVSAVDKLPGDGQYTMNPKVSVVQWKGEKLGMNEIGTVPIRSCTILVQDGQLLSGNVVIEMNGIKSTSQEGLAARNLTEHLRSKDFYDVATHPTAGFIFESGRTDGRGGLEFMGKLNIKGISQPAKGSLRFSSSDPVVATVGLTFNRADFDVQFGSGTFFDNLGDDLISDEVLLQIALVEDITLRKAN